MIAALELIFTSSARYGVSATDLNSELQQLGLPREHSTAVARLHTDHCPQIAAVLSSQSLRGDSTVNSYTSNEIYTKNYNAKFKCRKTANNISYNICTNSLEVCAQEVCFIVSSLSSIEVLPCDGISPVSSVALKLKKIDGNEEASTINISKDDVQMLLKGTWWI